ncbi:MAG: SPOR domain-containing protein [Salinivirgaceae bacterium]|nr:SPOR domain-containing protein [Salinivirgaceae bacterium]
MNIKLIVASVALTLAALNTNAQSQELVGDLKSQKQEQGTITIDQDWRINQMLDAYARINQHDGISGYRVQIFSGSGQNARSQMNIVNQKFINNFPDFDPARIYSEYKAPYFKLCVGDFRSRSEANAFYHVIRSLYPDSYVVKSKIKFPELSTAQKQ